MFKEKMTLLEDALRKNIFPRIDTFPCPYIKNAKNTGVIRIIFPEFTCVCPKTGYPDFASIDVYYLPAKTCIELKSWKLYLNSFRMIGSFHETVTAHLFATLKGLLQPKWLLLAGDFFPRGNVNTTIIFEFGNRPAAAALLLKKYKSHARGFTKA